MLNKKTGLIALFVSFAASELFAGTLTSYVVGDVLICFRKSSGANDLVVDAGPVATFTNATMNQRFPITQYAGHQLAAIGTNSVIWSAFTWLDDSALPASSQWTLFVSKHRTSPYTKSSAWSSAPQSAQEFGPAADMSQVVAGAAINLGFNGLNTAASIIEPDDTSPNSSYYPSGESYDYFMQGQNTGVFNLNGDWFDTPEITAAANFTTAGAVIRSDFYQIPPNDSGVGGGSGGAVKFLGYFELNTNGAMTYVAYPTPPTVATVAAGAITTTNALLNATVNPNADGTTLYFQYGLTTSYGSSSMTNIVGTTSGSYGLSVSNLIAGTTYHFRAAAYNHAGTNYGSDLSFTTASGGGLAVPVITGFGRTNGISYVSFSTGNSGTYTLRGTNSAGLGAARTNWPAIVSVGGNGLTNTLPDTTASPNKFYLITAQ